MKSYTDLEQSKKLVEILPIESADMFWYRDAVTKEVNPRIMNYIQVPELQSMYYSPCWSLAALISVLPSSMKDSIGMVYSLNMNKEYIEYSNPNISFPYSAYIHTCGNDNLIDACYEMIVKFHEQKIL